MPQYKMKRPSELRDKVMKMLEREVDRLNGKSENGPLSFDEVAVLGSIVTTFGKLTTLPDGLPSNRKNKPWFQAIADDKLIAMVKDVKKEEKGEED